MTDKSQFKMPHAPPRVLNARTALQGALGVQADGIAPSHRLVKTADLNLLLEWLNTLDTLAAV